ncbi:hypothetical protein [Streptomyces sp. NPDC002952]|uniref:hypothetical protein n=1 Tax=Streptomyces sp. NPDC002952 TaxID=3364673 RepID=UPI00367ACED3
MESAPGGEDGTTPGAHSIQTTVALSGDGTVIAQARHLAAGFLKRITVRFAPADDLTGRRPL